MKQVTELDIDLTIVERMERLEKRISDLRTEIKKDRIPFVGLLNQLLLAQKDLTILIRFFVTEAEGYDEFSAIAEYIGRTI